jgi:gas vesicle protein
VNGNKVGKFILIGAFAGLIISMFDRSSRHRVMNKSKGLMSDVSFYSRNTDLLKWKVQEKTEKLQLVYEQLSEDLAYIKEKVDELKTLTPQVKELVMDTKDTFVESKDGYKSIVSEKNMTGNT